MLQLGTGMHMQQAKCVSVFNYQYFEPARC